MHSERKAERREVILGYLSENSLFVRHSVFTTLTVSTRRRTKVTTESKPFCIHLSHPSDWKHLRVEHCWIEQYPGNVHQWTPAGRAPDIKNDQSASIVSLSWERFGVSHTREETPHVFSSGNRTIKESSWLYIQQLWATISVYMFVSAGAQAQACLFVQDGSCEGWLSGYSSASSQSVSVCLRLCWWLTSASFFVPVCNGGLLQMSPS